MTLNIPVFGICDTNVDPTKVTYAIPGNDDSIKATETFLKYFVEAIREGLKNVKPAEAGTKRPVRKA